ncbi:MAG: mechanosensitive ion channel [Candidatus Woesearchaeota archaeon]|jgi:small conductance mechanosensitive channel|nr:mechanosensitive ion channel [Candidatus Woesearchaeota archaeon]MDP7323544.1 mechanosensitive ion channel [Candidatus Woesearchaeota archaeon]|tara:strand:- start:51 stop:608 length:558 start_codon:yes stop_codon:yes gene_type:complete
MANPVDVYLDLQKILDPIFTRLAISIIILLVGLVLGRIVGKILDRVFKEIELDKILKKTTGAKFKIGALISRVSKYLIYFVFIIAALDRLGIQTVAFNIILGGFVLLVFLMIILSIKDFIPNLFAGFFLHKKGFVKEGDKIKVNEVQGQIIDISIVETKIKTKSGDILFIPNSFLTKHQVLKLKK